MALRGFLEGIKNLIEGIQSNIKGYLESTLSPEETVTSQPEDVQSALRESGIEASLQEIGEVQSDFEAQIEASEQISDLPLNSFVPDHLVQERPDWELQRGYLYRVKVTGRSLLTGSAEERHYSVYTDNPLLVEDVEAEIRDFLDTHAEDCDFVVESAELEDVIGRPDRRR